MGAGRNLQGAGELGVLSENSAHDPRHRQRGESGIDRPSISLHAATPLREKPLDQADGG